jgi:hypothetical protein
MILIIDDPSLSMFNGDFGRPIEVNITSMNA